MFCADLSHEQYPTLAAFIQTHETEPLIIYEWISGAADGEWYSYFPFYDHSFHPLATFQEYISLTQKEIVERIQLNRKRRLSGNSR